MATGSITGLAFGNTVQSIKKYLADKFFTYKFITIKGAVVHETTSIGKPDNSHFSALATANGHGRKPLLSVKVRQDRYQDIKICDKEGNEYLVRLKNDLIDAKRGQVMSFIMGCDSEGKMTPLFAKNHEDNVFSTINNGLRAFARLTSLYKLVMFMTMFFVTLLVASVQALHGISPVSVFWIMVVPLTFAWQFADLLAGTLIRDAARKRGSQYAREQGLLKEQPFMLMHQSWAMTAMTLACLMHVMM